jgi:hypothetical protein
MEEREREQITGPGGREGDRQGGRKRGRKERKRDEIKKRERGRERKGEELENHWASRRREEGEKGAREGVGNRQTDRAGNPQEEAGT